MEKHSQVSGTFLIKQDDNSNQFDCNELLNSNSQSVVYTNKMENVRQCRYAFERVLNFDYCNLLFCMMNIILSVLYCDADYNGKQNISKWCLSLTDPITCIEIFVTIFRYKAQVQLQINQKILQPTDGVYSSGKLPHIIFQTCILLIQPYSFLNNIYVPSINIFDQFQFQIKMNYVFVVLGFLKVFIALRVMLLRQTYMNPRSSRLCRMYGCQSDYLYAVKCLFKDSPIFFVLFVFAGSIIIFAICLRIAERDLVIQYPKHFNGKVFPYAIDQFWNAIWLTIITMTTVGYGDYSPRTLFGRLIDVVLVLWGTFIVSIMVVALTNTLNMDQGQKRALIVLNRLQSKKSLKDAAAFVITNYCKRFLINKKIKAKQIKPLKQQEIQKTNDIFYKYLQNFQRVQRQIRTMYQIDDIYQEMSRQFEIINQQVTELLKSQQQTILNVQDLLKYNRKQKMKIRVPKSLSGNNQK